MTSFASRMPIVDTDSHVTEPPDLWSSRLPAAWGDIVPHVRRDERRGEDRWQIGSKRLTGVANFAMAGWHEFAPSHPLVLDDADPASWHPGERLKRMDEFGLHAQVLYPNLLGFYSEVFLDQIKDPDALYACVRAYNDFLTDFASEDPTRFVPIMALPFWDVERSVIELRRCTANGHKGLLFSNAPEKVGLPPLRDEHWHPLFAEAEELGMSVNFHIGFMASSEEEMRGMLKVTRRADYAKQSSLAMISNAAAIAEITLSGICHRYPKLNFVSVESGFGWLPYLLEVLDWQWLNSGAREESPEMEMPSFYVRRQVFGSFWFEREAMRRTIDLLPDSVMFETDFPHPTSLSPGPASFANNPRDVVEDTLRGLPEELVRKVLFETAARVYHLDLPAHVELEPTVTGA